jgi:hypothetical protein
MLLLRLVLLPAVVLLPLQLPALLHLIPSAA